MRGEVIMREEGLRSGKGMCKGILRQEEGLVSGKWWGWVRWKEMLKRREKRVRRNGAVENDEGRTKGGVKRKN